MNLKKTILSVLGRDGGAGRAAPEIVPPGAQLEILSTWTKSGPRRAGAGGVREEKKLDKTRKTVYF